jgi:hypothetical protein
MNIQQVCDGWCYESFQQSDVIGRDQHQSDSHSLRWDTSRTCTTHLFVRPSHTSSVGDGGIWLQPSNGTAREGTVNQAIGSRDRNTKRGTKRLGVNWIGEQSHPSSGSSGSERDSTREKRRLRVRDGDKELSQSSSTCRRIRGNTMMSLWVRAASPCKRSKIECIQFRQHLHILWDCEIVVVDRVD